MQLEAESPPPLPGHCLNCGTPLSGRYCHRCGQRDFDFRRSFWSMLHEALESLFHVDGRFVRSVVELLFLPGRLTRAFLLGKRASQVPPLRFYLFVTLLYFLTLPLRTHFEIPEIRLPDPATAPAAAASEPAGPPAPAETGDNATAGPNEPGQEFLRGLQAAIERGEVSRDFHAPTREEILDLVVGYSPKLLFLFLPLLALGTRLLYLRAGYSYLEHLVIALHLGTFFFTFSLFVEGWSLLLGFAWTPLATGFDALAFGYGALYLPLLLRRVFPRSIWDTLWRTALLYLAGGLAMFFSLIALGAVLISRSGLLP